MKPVEELSLEELNALRQQILNRCAHWLSCQDGSYECALHNSGYDTVVREIIRRKEYVD